MGYNSQPLNGGANKPIGASFVTVGSKGVALTTLVPQGLTANNNSIISLQLLSSGGSTTNKYEYYYGSKRSSFKENGWYDGNAKLITADNDVFFAPGEGFWVNCLQSGVTLQNSGEVLFSSVTRSLNYNGNILIANPYPTDVKLSNMSVGGEITANNNSIISLQLLSSGGSTTNKYEYYYGSKRSSFKENGWYDGNAKLVTTDNDAIFPAGQGFWVNCLQNGLTLTFSLGEEAKAVEE